MDSLDTQCLLIQLAEGDMPPPDVWRHDRSGALSCGYERGELVFTWPADHLGRAEIWGRWEDEEIVLTWPHGPRSSELSDYTRAG